MMRIFAMLLAAICLVPECAEPLERLFFSAEERRRMNMVRDRGTSSEAYVAPNVEGVVRRSDGRNTIWINGRPLSANELQSAQADKLSVDSGERITIRSSSDSAQAAPVVPAKPAAAPKSRR